MINVIVQTVLGDLSVNERIGESNLNCGRILTIYVRLAQAVRVLAVTQRVEILPG